MGNRIYGYIRVSTLAQKEDRQWLAMEKFGVPKECVFADKQSGRTYGLIRSVIVNALKKARSGWPSRVPVNGDERYTYTNFK